MTKSTIQSVALSQAKRNGATPTIELESSLMTQELITSEKFDAVLFDLDGVITDTASIHAKCWKKMFDNFLRHYSEAGKGEFEPFDIASDYKRHVDGKLRYDGVRSFLESRGIELPYGDPEQPPITRHSPDWGTPRTPCLNNPSSPARSSSTRAALP